MKFLTILTLFLMISTTWAQSAKIGIVNLEEVLVKSKYYPEFNEKVEAFIAQKNVKITELDKKIEAKEKSIKLGIIAPEGTAQVLAEIEALKKEQDELLIIGQKEVTDFEIKLRQPIIKAILIAVKKTAKEKNYNLILEKSAPILESSLVIENIDSLVIQELNK